ncbi:MAG: leucyl aminopeptidase, partial [Chloroflexota bacterium]
MIHRPSGAAPTVTVDVNDQAIGDLTADTLIVMSPKIGDDPSEAINEIDSHFGGAFLTALSDAGFSGNIGANVQVPAMGKLPVKRVIVCGISNTECDADDLRRAFGSAARVAKRAGASQVACIPDFGGLDDQSGYRAATEGVLLSLYDFETYRSDQDDDDDNAKSIASWTFIGPEDDAAREGIRIGYAVATGIYLARDMVFEPGNTIYPETLAEVARETATNAELEYQVFDENQLAEMEAGAIVAVGRGSEHPPRLVHMTYQPTGESQGTIALIGKGITFDTGGMSLKSGSGMVPMKTDMAGAAAVLGAMRAISELDLPFTVHGIIAAAENTPSSTAYRPSDVLTAKNGKTIEVISTDAEGRLVLADAMVYAAEQGVDEMIDLATLTGAKVVALGEESVAVYSNDDEMARAVVAAGEEAGELFWHMPLWKELRKKLNSEIADMKNSGGRGGGSITAALFLSEFTEGVKWAHLDIAGAAWTSSTSGYTPKGATGVATRAL